MGPAFSTNLPQTDAPLKIAVVGAGISGMSAAWLLSQRHEVTVYEAENRLGGHSHTVEADAGGGQTPVDMGFIVYNEPNYPNLVALFDHLGVPTEWSDMSFGVSLNGGDMEYSSSDMFAQKRNLFRPRFWSMLNDLMRFYREAPGHACALDSRLTSLGDYLCDRRYGRAFMDDHLLPQAAAIWSASIGAIRDFPAASFIRFCENHGLLQVTGRVEWRTVSGGSREYVKRLTAAYANRVRQACAVRRISRDAGGVTIGDALGRSERFDHVVIAAHADRGLALLEAPSPQERALLGAFAYTRNHAVLHTDTSLMPRRRKAWSSWNYVGDEADAAGRRLCVTYWMNKLQNLPEQHPLFVTLNPVRAPAVGTLLRTEIYEHPLFDAAATRAQRELWRLQGAQNTWWCGAYFGSGFHEDGLQSGLAVAEALGGVRRPWRVENESGRIHLGPPAQERTAVAGGRGVTAPVQAHSALYEGAVVHQRFAPKRHRLRYRMFQILFDLDELPSLARRTRLFSLNGFNLFSFHERDHGDGRADLKGYVREVLLTAGIETGGGPIRLLCMPRMLGHVFNPISIYYCHHADGGLAAVLYEVNNTFGQRHSYLIEAETGADGTVLQACDKRFHVSPFMDMEMGYAFRLTRPGETIATTIHGEDAQGRLLIAAAFSGVRKPFTDGALARAFLAFPLLTLKVVAAIHWEAALIFLKGVGFRARPAAPRAPVSVSEPRAPARREAEVRPGACDMAALEPGPRREAKLAEPV